MENKIKTNLLGWTPGNVKGFYGKNFIIMDKGSLKQIKIEPFSNYPQHVHPDKTEYAYIIEGNPEFVIDGKMFTSEPGDFFIFPFGKNHEIKNQTDKKCILLIGAIKN